MAKNCHLGRSRSKFPRWMRKAEPGPSGQSTEGAPFGHDSWKAGSPEEKGATVSPLPTTLAGSRSRVWVMRLAALSREASWEVSSSFSSKPGQ